MKFLGKFHSLSSKIEISVQKFRVLSQLEKTFGSSNTDDGYRSFSGIGRNLWFLFLHKIGQIQKCEDNHDLAGLLPPPLSSGDKIWTIFFSNIPNFSNCNSNWISENRTFAPWKLCEILFSIVKLCHKSFNKISYIPFSLKFRNYSVRALTRGYR